MSVIHLQKLLLRCLIENVWFEVTIVEISVCFSWELQCLL